MLKKLKHIWKNSVYKMLSLFLATVGKGLLNLLLWTCRWEVQGLERFCEIASKDKCVLMLWHNRLAIAPFILHRFTPRFIYAAFISNSRDGQLISTFVHSYKAGRTIRVPHHSRHQALRELIRRIEEKKEIVAVTPDGPRGPRYSVKPGLALAALETQAYVFPLNWEATRFWEFKTWDRLRLPKPFSTVRVQFAPPVRFDQPSLELQDAQNALQQALP